MLDGQFWITAHPKGAGWSSVTPEDSSTASQLGMLILGSCVASLECPILLFSVFLWRLYSCMCITEHLWRIKVAEFTH